MGGGFCFWERMGDKSRRELFSWGPGAPNLLRQNLSGYVEGWYQMIQFIINRELRNLFICFYLFYLIIFSVRVWFVRKAPNGWWRKTGLAGIFLKEKNFLWRWTRIIFFLIKMVGRSTKNPNRLFRAKTGLYVIPNSLDFFFVFFWVECMGPGLVQLDKVVRASGNGSEKHLWLYTCV